MTKPVAIGQDGSQLMCFALIGWKYKKPYCCFCSDGCSGSVSKA